MPISPQKQAELDNFNRTNSQGDVDLTRQIIPKFPPYPPDVKKRFPSLEKHEDAVENWRVRTNIALRGGVT